MKGLEHQVSGRTGRVSDALRLLAERLPSGAVIPVVREDLLDLIGGSQSFPMADLTVEQVAHILNRKPSTVRGWCNSGQLSAYRLNGREYRVTSQSLESYQSGQRGGQPRGLGAWKTR